VLTALVNDCGCESVVERQVVQQICITAAYMVCGLVEEMPFPRASTVVACAPG
jgi:hypothetical protein